MVASEPFFQPRGTPFSVFHRTKTLAKFGHVIDLLTYHVGKDVDIPNTRIYRNRSIKFIKQVPIGPSATKFFLDPFLFIKGLFLLRKGNYDCIHAHEEAGFFAILYKKLSDLPVVYDMHSSISEQMINFEFSSNPLVLKIASWIERQIIRNADAVICICPHLGDVVHSIDAKKKTFIIENTPMVEDLKNVSEDEKSKFRGELNLKNAKVALYTGTLETYQGIPLIIKSIPHVVEKYKNIKFVLVGREPHQIKTFEKMTQENKIEDYVIFTGQRPFEEMVKFMAISDILLSPREIGTNTPLKLYSYLKSGKPIVATDLLTHTQVLNSDVAVLTPPNSKDFAKGILKLLENPSLGDKLGQAGINLMKKEYSYEKFVEKTKAVYDYIARVNRYGKE
jgi:glycosyltransferase involved in cell wall biosynthesis